MSIYTPPPPLRTFAQDKPTLIVAWWCTLFASVLILFRVIGQLVRLERLQAADTMALLTIPALLVRMAAVHVVLLWGTGNADFSHLWTGDVRLDSIKELAGYSGLEGLVRREEVNAWGMGDRMVYEREMGSRMVLMARIFFPIW